jgi:hypothetical protein
VGLELEVLQATAGGRVAFGEPAIVRSDPPAAAAPATRTVILVIGSAIDRRDVPPWGAAAGLASIAELARAGAVFRDYRAPSTLPAATMASMLTALSPGTHGLRDQAARLGESMRNVGEIVKQAGGRAAMVTGVPTTFAAFGFAAGWDDYRMISPVHDIAATEPYTWAARWLAGELETEEPIKRLLVVHGRGAHPPWDLSKKEVMRLPPTGYTGPITARRGGIVLGQVRSRRARRIGDDDWERVNALTQAALVKQAAGLGQLLKVLRKNEAFNDALIIFVGDVGRGARPDVPYDPAGDPTEERLTVPLIVKFPGGAFAGKEVQVHATAVDIAVTILESLGLRVPEPATGVNLYQLARGREPVVGRALLATSGRHFATRYGSYRLSGEFGKVPRLCQLDIDPACVSDKFGTATLVGPASWQQTFEALRRAEQLALRLGRKPDDRVPADIDPETAAALAVWGDIPPPSAPSPSPEP